MTDLEPPTYDVHFHFDPMCPFAWQTSRWAVRVAELLDVRIGWRFISLKMINEDTDPAGMPPGLADAQERGHRLLRVAAAVAAAGTGQGGGNDAVGRFYTAIGESQWYAQPPADGNLFSALATASTAEQLLETAGLATTFATAGDDATWDDGIRADTEAALDRTGRDVGTPILHFDPPHGNALFGPVISTVPNDDDSIALWHAVVAAARVASFAELKRSKRDPLDLPLLSTPEES